MNLKIVKTIASLPPKEESIIINTLIKSSFIPLIRKFNFIVKRHPNLYSGDINADREFLNFANKMRNCLIHSNGVYFGKDYYYELKEAEFRFKNGKVFEQAGAKSQDIYLDIAIKLKEIFECLMCCISDIEFIEYPNDGQNIA